MDVPHRYVRNKKSSLPGQSEFHPPPACDVQTLVIVLSIRPCASQPQPFSVLQKAIFQELRSISWYMYLGLVTSKYFYISFVFRSNL